jgi:hypothetical protein
MENKSGTIRKSESSNFRLLDTGRIVLLDKKQIAESIFEQIKQAVSKLPQRTKLALAQWLHAQVDDRLNDEEMMSIAVEGARALGKREATYAKRKARRSFACRFQLYAAQGKRNL